MMIHEFEQLTGIQVAPECWDRIEYVYMNCEQFKTKEQIADYYKKHDMNGIEKPVQGTEGEGAEGEGKGTGASLHISDRHRAA